MLLAWRGHVDCYASRVLSTLIAFLSFLLSHFRIVSIPPSLSIFRFFLTYIDAVLLLSIFFLANAVCTIIWQTRCILHIHARAIRRYSAHNIHINVFILMYKLQMYDSLKRWPASLILISAVSSFILFTVINFFY